MILQLMYKSKNDKNIVQQTGGPHINNRLITTSPRNLQKQNRLNSSQVNETIRISGCAVLL